VYAGKLRPIGSRKRQHDHVTQGNKIKMSFLNLQNRTSIVTGATGGIGRAICEELAKAGSDIALFDIDDEKMEQFARKLTGEFGISTRVYKLDVRRSADLCSRAWSVVDEFGGIDHLINAHGVQFLSPFAEFPEDKWTFIHDVNLMGVFLASKAVWPHMVKRKRGRIVNVASVHGIVASELKSAYIASKHGVVGLTRATALEGAEHGITVNAVCPGAVLTDLVRQQGPQYAKRLGPNVSEQQALNRAFLDTMPTRRFIDPSEIGQLCTYLCSDAARSITGSAIAIDGGWSAR